jgi:hypothetical protein
VRIQASVSGTNVTATKIWVDGVSKYSTSGPGVDTTLSMSNGTHRIAVQAYEKDGSTAKSVVYVNVSTSSSSDTTSGAVTILQPTNNSTVGSPVRIQATVNSTSVQYTKIFIDGVSKYTKAGAGVDTSLSMSAGSHRIAVQAGLNDGTVTKSVVYVNVSSTSSPDTSNLTTFIRIEEQSEWQTCGNCGNTGASGNTASYNMTRGISSPSKDGSSAKFWIGGSYAYANAYWYIRQTAPKAPVTYLKYEFDLYVPKAYVSTPQAIEFECQQRANGYKYNFAWQANYSGGSWRIFDYVNKKWISTGLSLTKFSADTWHHIIAEYHTEGGYTVHDALTIDGVRHAVGIKQKAMYVGGTGLSFTNAFQLDLNKYATDFYVYVDGMMVSYK